MIEFDENPEDGSTISIASNVDPEAEVSEQIHQAYKYGFRRGWQTCWFEQKNEEKA